MGAGSNRDFREGQTKLNRKGGGSKEVKILSLDEKSQTFRKERDEEEREEVGKRQTWPTGEMEIKGKIKWKQ